MYKRQGLFLWNQLPDQVPIHFGLNGQADNYAGKAFVVFGLPLLMAALQVLLLVVTCLLYTSVSSQEAMV